MSYSKINTCFVDRDGTLFGTCRLNYEAYLHAFESMGVHVPRNLFDAIHNGHHISTILHEAEVDFSQDQYNQFRQKKAKFFNSNIHLANVNYNLFNHLESFSNKYLITNSSTDSTNNLIFSLQPKWEKKFEIITPELGLRPKPNPDLYKYAIKISGKEIHEILVFEDSINGIISATDSGLSIHRVQHLC